MTQPNDHTNHALLAGRVFHDANQQVVPYHGEPLSWRVSAYVIIRRADQVLLIKNSREQAYDIVGGGIDFGESVTDALNREAMEEAGAQVKVGQLLANKLDWFYYYQGTYHQTLQLLYAAELVGELQPPTDPEIEWVGWVPLSEAGTKYPLPPFVSQTIAALK